MVPNAEASGCNGSRYTICKLCVGGCWRNNVCSRKLLAQQAKQGTGLHKGVESWRSGCGGKGLEVTSQCLVLKHSRGPKAKLKATFVRDTKPQVRGACLFLNEQNMILGLLLQAFWGVVSTYRSHRSRPLVECTSTVQRMLCTKCRTHVMTSAGYRACWAAPA